MHTDCVSFISCYDLATKNLHLATIFYHLVTKWRLEDFFNFEPCLCTGLLRMDHGDASIYQQIIVHLVLPLVTYPSSPISVATPKSAILIGAEFSLLDNRML